MSTIHPPANGVSYNREEQAANTHISFRRTELTAEQMIARDAQLRASAPKNPNSYNAKAAADIAERQARQAAHDDKRRAELASVDKKPVGMRRQYEKDSTWNEIAPKSLK